MVHISNKLGGLDFILSMGTQFSIFGCWGGFLYFPLFQRKIVWVQIKSNQSKISRNWTDIMWVLNCQYEPFYLWIFQFKILLLWFFYHPTFLQQTSAEVSINFYETSLGFYLSLPPPSYHMLRWIYRIFFQIWSVIRKLHQILFSKPRRRSDKIPAWREFWNVFSTHLDTKIWDSMLWKLRCLQNYPDWFHVSKLWKIK